MQVPGVVVPAWLAIVFASALIFSVVGFILSLVLLADFRADAREERAEDIQRFTSEARLLELHVKDVENVLIRYGMSKRDDFAPWPQILEGEVRDEPTPDK